MTLQAKLVIKTPFQLFAALGIIGGSVLIAVYSVLCIHAINQHIGKYLQWIIENFDPAYETSISSVKYKIFGVIGGAVLLSLSVIALGLNPLARYLQGS